MPKVLIVEDEAFIAMDLGALVAEATGADTCLAATARAGDEAREAGIDFALLDVNVSDGTTFELAHRLMSDNVPFAFVSARDPAFLPNDLRGVPFLSKPYRREEVLHVLQKAFSKRSLRSF
jgi:DNA-binding response OmpR family regulator